MVLNNVMDKIAFIVIFISFAFINTIRTDNVNSCFKNSEYSYSEAIAGHNVMLNFSNCVSDKQAAQILLFNNDCIFIKPIGSIRCACNCPQNSTAITSPHFHSKGEIVLNNGTVSLLIKKATSNDNGFYLYRFQIKHSEIHLQIKDILEVEEKAISESLSKSSGNNILIISIAVPGAIIFVVGFLVIFIRKKRHSTDNKGRYKTPPTDTEKTPP